MFRRIFYAFALVCLGAVIGCSADETSQPEAGNATSQPAETSLAEAPDPTPQPVVPDIGLDTDADSTMPKSSAANSDFPKFEEPTSDPQADTKPEMEKQETFEFELPPKERISIGIDAIYEKWGGDSYFDANDQYFSKEVQTQGTFVKRVGDQILIRGEHDAPVRYVVATFPIGERSIQSLEEGAKVQLIGEMAVLTEISEFEDYGNVISLSMSRLVDDSGEAKK